MGETNAAYSRIPTTTASSNRRCLTWREEVV